MEAHKKRKSNEARLQAIENRIKEIESNKSIVSASLKLNSNSDSQHVKFDSDSDDNTVNNDSLLQYKVNGGKSKDIFGRDTTRSNGEIETYKFPDKPQFEGNLGAKLFKLQQQTRNDDRFRLDERFADSNSEVEIEEEKNNFVEEKQKYLKILGDVLGKDIHKERRPRRVMKHVIRFDPTLESHRKYIIERRDTLSTEKQDSVVGVSPKQTQIEANEIPKVSRQTYYEYNNGTSIASLFGNTNTNPEIESGMFNFEIQETERNILAKPYIFENLQENGMSQLVDTEHHFVTDCISSEQSNGVKESSNSETQNLFFFHSNNSKLRNRLDQIKFCRQQDLETLHREWHEKAVSLMRDCKRKHRDAVRWKNKSLSLK